MTQGGKKKKRAANRSILLAKKIIIKDGGTVRRRGTGTCAHPPSRPRGSGAGSFARAAEGPAPGAAAARPARLASGAWCLRWVPRACKEERGGEPQALPGAAPWALWPSCLPGSPACVSLL